MPVCVCVDYVDRLESFNTEISTIHVSCHWPQRISAQKHNTDVAHYNFDAGQPIFMIFRRDVAERVCYQTVICYLTSPN